MQRTFKWEFYLKTSFTHNFDDIEYLKLRKQINIRPNIMKKPFNPVSNRKERLLTCYVVVIIKFNVEVLLHPPLKAHFEERNQRRDQAYYNRRPSGKLLEFRLANYRVRAQQGLSIPKL